MSIVSEARPADSPYIETIMRGYTARDGSTMRPAECHWHLVLRKLDGKTDLLVVGPWTSAGVLSYTEGAELLWIKLKLGTFMPRWPTRSLLDSETVLPSAACHSFLLHGFSWQFPNYENVETFIGRLARAGVLARDPLVNAALGEQHSLHGQSLEIPDRTLRHRFLHATGMNRNQIQQIERAQRAADLLRQGISIPDTIYQTGYFDQPHLTRTLKRWVGYTPAQLTRTIRLGSLSACAE